MKTSRFTTGFLLLGAALAFIAFGASLWHDFAPSDDLFLIYNNLAIRGISFENLKTIFTTFDPELYIPLTFFSYQLNYLISGLEPWSYHLGNIILHVLNVILVSQILRKLLNSRLAMIGALIFAVHPINAEAVVWLAGRKDLLSTLFALLTISAYLKFRDGQAKAYLLSLIYFLLALLAKVMVVTMPVLLLILDFYQGRSLKDKKVWLEKVPYAALSAIFAWVAVFGKERVLEGTPFFETILMACKSLVFYIQKLFVPTGLSTVYPYHGEITLSAFWPFVLLAVILLGLMWWFRRHRAFSAGLFFFLVALAPTFYNFNKAGYLFFASDRYVYLPLLGFLLVILSLGHALWQRMGSSKEVANGTVFFIVLVFTGLSYLQTQTWRAPDTLYLQTLKHYPESVAARASLARIWREQGKYEEAFDVLKEGLTYGKHAQLSIGAAMVYAKVGQVGSAIQQLKEATGLDPTLPEPHYHLASLELIANRPEAAKPYLLEAVELDGSYVSARVKLGNIYLQEGALINAREQFEAALEWNSNDLGVQVALMELELADGNLNAAKEYLKKAQQLDAGHPAVRDRSYLLD